MSTEFDFSKYLTESQITDVAKKVCEEQVREYIQMVFMNRSQAGVSIADQIIKSVAETYTKKLSNEYELNVLDRIKGVIDEDKPNDPDSQTFHESLRWHLSKVAEEYIKTNSDALQLEMKDSIHDEAKSLTAYQLSSIIAKEINIQDIIMKALIGKAPENK